MTHNELTVLVPVANAAVPLGTEVPSSLDRLRVRCVEKACQIARELGSQETPYVWSLGAGVASTHRRGPTLAFLMRKRIEHTPGVSQMIVCNEDQTSGVHSLQSEITWAIKAARAHYSDRKLRFFVVTDPYHVWHVQMIKWLWHPGTAMTCHACADVSEIPHFQPPIGYRELLWQRLGVGYTNKKTNTTLSLRTNAK